MNTFTQGPRTGEFLVSEGNGSISRERITVAAGAALVAGQLLGFDTVHKVHVPYNPAGTDGAEEVVGILYARLAESEQDRPAVAVVRLAEVAGELLAGLDAPAAADLKLRNIIVR